MGELYETIAEGLSRDWQQIISFEGVILSIFSLLFGKEGCEMLLEMPLDFHDLGNTV